MINVKRSIKFELLETPLPLVITLMLSILFPCSYLLRLESSLSIPIPQRKKLLWFMELYHRFSFFFLLAQMLVYDISRCSGSDISYHSSMQNFSFPLLPIFFPRRVVAIANSTSIFPPITHMVACSIVSSFQLTIPLALLTLPLLPIHNIQSPTKVHYTDTLLHSNILGIYHYPRHFFCTYYNLQSTCLQNIISS
ncbi:hypothetical protein K435DRAFT_379711 [Dendrothele bispora CBS 962.96]|uniref:Uncharacterized protein n=1 Tax=Dendrothele bispora (strain CBS 962.96) TaxID=1314807 RepID=A0A4S8LBR3_DENBC|nr:hypothetical protein K435DRAFT_379711 [Dendrothele bispora CBS 962.96]